MLGIHDTPGCQNIPHEEDLRPVTECIRDAGKRPLLVVHLRNADTLDPGNSGECHRVQLFHVHHTHENKTRVRCS